MLDMIERLNSVADFDRSLMSANLILFAFAAWSGPCYRSRTTMTDAFDQLRRSSTLLDVSIAELDFTDQSGNTWNRVAAWLSSQNNIDTTSYMYSGAGSVAWVRDGSVVDSVVNAHHTGTAELIDRSILAFPNRIPNGG
jgi:hypothetical protein